ncbi:MAG: twin-arginine translocase TatA/TatE family subunit [Bacteroidetes bacterium]|nr:MAG: twin-arginine translocase TatA/TatE family subunit [Bacteroidota bacterium]
MNTAFTILAMIGPTEIIIIAIIILLLFGGRKIPELMRGLGKGMKEFKDAQKNNDNDNEAETKNEK